MNRDVPVVKDLAAENVSSDAPAVLVPPLPQPVVAEDLGIEVVCLKRGVVHSVGVALGEEEDVVIHLLVSPIQSIEYRPVDLVGVVDEL